MVHLFGADDGGADRRASLPRLALQPLGRAPLPVAHGDVVDDGVAADGLDGLRGTGVAHAAPDDDPELRFPVDRVRRLRKRDRVAGPGEGRRELGEERGMGRQLPLHLFEGRVTTGARSASASAVRGPRACGSAPNQSKAPTSSAGGCTSTTLSPSINPAMVPSAVRMVTRRTAGQALVRNARRRLAEDTAAMLMAAPDAS